ncbi:MAG TPA: hypothetical protein VFB50_13710 [Chloroflexota bacterium]|nr:hypothetical protein [Chloroflexota bacterium]
MPGPEAGERAWRTWGIHAIYRHVQAVHTYLRRHFAPQLAERAATVPEKHETPADKPRTKDQAPAVSADSRHPGGADRLVNDPVWQGVMEELLTFHSGDSAGGQRRDYVQALQDVLQQHTNDKRELPGRIVERLRTAIGRADTDRAAANRLIGDWVRNYRRRKR